MAENNNGNTSTEYLCPLYNETQCDIVVIVEKVSASLSVIGCLITLIIILFYQRYYEYNQRFTLHLSVAALLEAVCFFFNDYDSFVPKGAEERPSTPCRLQAAWLFYTLWVVLLWLLFITVYFWCNKEWATRFKKYEIVMSVLCWVLPGIICGIPFIIDGVKRSYSLYGPVLPWCWLHNGYIIWKLGLWYIWSFTLFVGIFACNIFKKRKNNSDGVVYISSKWKEIMLIHGIHIIRPINAFFFFLIFVFFPFINDIYSFYVSKNQLIVIPLLNAFSLPFLGGTITVCFMLDKTTRDLLHPKVIGEMLRRRFRAIDQLIKKDREPSCDTFLVDILSTASSVTGSYRESVGSHYLEINGNTGLTDIASVDQYTSRATETARKSVYEPNKENEVLMAKIRNEDSIVELKVQNLSDIAGDCDKPDI